MSPFIFLYRKLYVFNLIGNEHTTPENLVKVESLNTILEIVKKC